MDNNYIAISSLALDLRRIAQMLHRGSLNGAHRFAQEAYKRSQEINLAQTPNYIQKLISQFEKNFNNGIISVEQAETALMLSTLFQNYCTQTLLKPTNQS